MEYLYYLKFVAVLVAGVLIGRWLDQERKRLKAAGEPWYKMWGTTPGIVVILILFVLFGFRIYLRFFS